MNDNKLVEMIREVDDTFANLIGKYQLLPLSFSSILLARILLINEACGTGQDFRQLLSEVAVKTPKSQEVVHWQSLKTYNRMIRLFKENLIC